MNLKTYEHSFDEECKDLVFSPLAYKEQAMIENENNAFLKQKICKEK